jgi:protein TonB
VAVTHPTPIPVPLTKATAGATPGINLPQSLTLKLQNGTASITMQDQAFGSRYAYYVDIVSKKVAQNWRSQEADPGTSNGKRVTLLFDIARDGTPNTIRVETRSGSPSLDTSALRALQRVDGFGPLPGSADHVTVEYSFDYQQQ